MAYSTSSDVELVGVRKLAFVRVGGAIDEKNPFARRDGDAVQGHVPRAFKQIANLWSLWDYPSTFEPWSLEQQLEAVKADGFDGFTTGLTPAPRP